MAGTDMKGEIQGPETIQPEFDIKGVVPKAKAAIPHRGGVSRRDFLKLAGAGLLGVVEAADMLNSVIKHGDINHTLTAGLIDEGAAKIKATVGGQNGGNPDNPTATPEVTVTRTQEPATATSTATRTPDATSTSVSKLDLVTNETDLEKLPSADWSYLNSEQFLDDLNQADRDGRITHAPETAVFLKPGDLNLPFEIKGGSLTLKKWGFDTIFTLLNDRDYGDSKHRIYNTVGIWLSKANGVDVVAFVVRWQNSDGTAGYLGYYSPRDGSQIKLVLQLAVGSSNRYPVGFFFSSQDSCQTTFQKMTQSTTKAAALCDFYFKNLNVMLNKDIYDRWKDTGKLKNEKVIPFMPASFQLMHQ